MAQTGTDILSLPLEIHMAIVKELKLYPKLQFSLKETCRAFLYACPAREELRKHFRYKDQRYGYPACLDELQYLRVIFARDAGLVIQLIGFLSPRRL